MVRQEEILDAEAMVLFFYMKVIEKKLVVVLDLQQITVWSY